MTITTGTLVKREPSNGHVSREWIALLEPAAALANQVAGTGFVPSALRGNPAGIVAAVLYGDELGLGPMQSLAKIAVIEGKPTLSAEAQRALILAAGHELRIDEATVTKVTIAGRRAGSNEWNAVTWTLDDAKRAGLAGRQNWRTYPRQMLTARATAELARLMFADVIGGLAATEEIEDVDPLALPIAMSGPTVTPKTVKRQRRKRQTPTPDASAEGPGQEGDDASAMASNLPPLPDEPADSLLQPTPSGEPGGDSPAEPVELDAPSVGVEDAAEVAQDEETTASSAAGHEPAASAAQLKALDKIVGTQRETEIEVDGSPIPLLTTEQVWAATATRRNVDVDVMIDLLSGRDSDGVLHWSPLRDSLTKSEASDLISKLEDRARKWGVT